MLDFDTAFADRSRGGAVHFIATYLDGTGRSHRLEEWRAGDEHLRRRTDDRIDLHADAEGKRLPGAATEYVWQVIDLKSKVDHRIRSSQMLETGMAYNFWSMAHVLMRPAGRFTVTALPAKAHGAPGAGLPPCTWYALAPDGLAASHICWSGAIAAPLIILSQAGDGSFHLAFAIKSVDRAPLAASLFAVELKDLRIEDAAQFVDKD